MSAAKRRIKRKIAQLVRMDSQSKRMSPQRMATFWVLAIVPLARLIIARGQGWRLITAVFARIGNRGVA
jgi:hypothetical protein